MNYGMKITLLSIILMGGYQTALKSASAAGTTAATQFSEQQALDFLCNLIETERQAGKAEKDVSQDVGFALIRNPGLKGFDGNQKRALKKKAFDVASSHETKKLLVQALQCTDVLLEKAASAKPRGDLISDLFDPSLLGAAGLGASSSSGSSLGRTASSSSDASSGLLSASPKLGASDSIDSISDGGLSFADVVRLAEEFINLQLSDTPNTQRSAQIKVLVKPYQKDFDNDLPYELINAFEQAKKDKNVKLLAKIDAFASTLNKDLQDNFDSLKPNRICHLLIDAQLAHNAEEIARFTAECNALHMPADFYLEILAWRFNYDEQENEPELSAIKELIQDKIKAKEFTQAEFDKVVATFKKPAAESSANSIVDDETFAKIKAVLNT